MWEALKDRVSFTKVIHFDNDDVPKFLEKLQRFKERSREAGKDLRIKGRVA
jgi:hypothetical protein